MTVYFFAATSALVVVVWVALRSKRTLSAIMKVVNCPVPSAREHHRFWLPLTVESSNVSSALSVQDGVRPVLTLHCPLALTNGSCV